MRFSSYNIMTKKISSGDHVILNGRTGLLDLIDEEAYELISSHEDDDDLSEDVMEQMEEVCDHFLERGFLTDLSKMEELEAARKMAREIADNLVDDKWSVILVPNLGCNYRCPYCFEKEGGYPNIVMNKKQVDAVFNIIKDKMISDEIVLYGGEPLAKENRDIIKYIIHKGTELGKSFFAVTNGHDLDNYIDLVGSDKITILQITMDGPKEIHDKRRITTNGESSYDKIISNIERVLNETDAEVRLRINLDVRNAPFILKLFDEFDKRGFLDSDRFMVGASPVVGIGDKSILHDEISRLERAVSSKYPGHGESLMGSIRVSNDMILPTLLFRIPMTLKVTECGASHCMKVFTADGSIYSCWSCVGRSDQKIGQFGEDGYVEWNDEVLGNWKSTMLFNNEKCLKCKYAFLCSGGCAWQSMPGVSEGCSFECDYYFNRFDDFLARVTDEYLSAGSK